jgi:hypothetical protein
MNDLPAGPLGDLTQFPLLIGRGLVDCRNPEVENGVFQSTSSLITHEPQANRTSITFEDNPLRRVNALSDRGSIWVIAAR